ncbi:MAG: right-handed parallel beta-helix repeat-containing protein [Oscillospiraceae bacterium]
MKRKALSAVVLSALSLSGINVYADSSYSIFDISAIKSIILNRGNNTDEYDLSGNGTTDIFDLCIMKNNLINADEENISNKVYVNNADELKSALADAKAGDEIILESGEYTYSGSTPKGRTFTGEADGTEDMPIILRSADADNPAVIKWTTLESNYGLTITGDWWIVKDIVVTNVSKGIIVDNSNHTKLINCEVYDTGTEGIHFRDGSSYCTAESCYVHDTGLINQGYGEGIYVGSAKSTTGYAFECDYNTISNCTFGPDVAAEHIDVKEYTTGTIIENCIFNGEGISGGNSADSFVNLKGNDCILRYCTGYRNDCENINRAFEANDVVEGWGQNSMIYGNKVYMDSATNKNGGKMYFLNAWDCSATVWDNFMAYEDKELFSVDDEEDHWEYYNCNLLTYGSYEILDK